MREPTFNGRDLIYFKHFLAVFKGAWYFLLIHEGAVVWFFRKFSTGFDPYAAKARLILSSNGVNRHEEKITSYIAVGNHLLGHYETNAVIGKANE